MVGDENTTPSSPPPLDNLDPEFVSRYRHLMQGIRAASHGTDTDRSSGRQSSPSNEPREGVDRSRRSPLRRGPRRMDL